MATFKIILDKRIRLKNGRFNLCLRASVGRHIQYLKLGRGITLTENDFNRVFEKNSMDKASVEFREKCVKYVSRAERIFASLTKYDPKKFSQLFYEDKDPHPIREELPLKDLFNRYVQVKKIKPKTIRMYQAARNFFENFRPGITAIEVTPDFLEEVEEFSLNRGVSQCTIDSYNRHLCSVINHFIKVDKIIPLDYQYPYGKGGYQIKNEYPMKQTISMADIKRVVEFDDFLAPEQEWARDIWLMLYRCNGINFIDLLKMRWDYFQNGFIIFHREKTRTTKKKHRKMVTIPVTEKVQHLLDKLGDTNSPYVLGILKEGHTKENFAYLNEKYRKLVNKELGYINQKLGLPIPLKIKNARDAYANTLKRSGKSDGEISDMLTHSDTKVTQHYLSAFELEQTSRINDCLL